ncbi:FAD-binding protein [Spirillospora sp. NPDC049024]
MTSVERLSPPLFDGDLVLDGPALEAAAEDFGHLVRREPLAVVRPRTAADVVRATRWAAERGWKIAPRGEGHSLYGRAQVDGGIVVDMSGLNGVHDLGEDQVAVDAGATWRSVLAETLPRGLTPPVLTNFLDLSVGGTLSVGGLGGTTHRYGLQTDQVLELEVVTGDGRLLTCSAHERTDLFDAVRAGLGQFGTITRARLALMPAPERVRRYTLAYPDLAGLVRDQRLVVEDGRAEHLQGAILAGGAGWQYQLEMVVFARDGELPPDAEVLAGLTDDRAGGRMEEQSYREYALSFDALESALRSTGQWSNPHPWLLTVLPGSTAERIAGDILGALTAGDLGEYGRVTFYPIPTGRITTPLLRLPAEGTVFPFNLVRFPVDDDPAQAERMVTQNRALYDRVRAAGGVLYPVSGFPFTPDDWRDHFGELWPAFRSAKERFDPGRVLTPGQGVFAAVPPP